MWLRRARPHRQVWNRDPPSIVSSLVTGRIGLGLACVAFLGCTSPGPRPAPAPEVEVAEAPTAPSPAIPAAAPTPSAPEVSPIDIGWTGRPKISRAARTLNKKALAAHREGRFEESRDGFAQALADSPDHDLVRYNLACALSRLGELDAAQRELLTLLHRDLRRFQTRWRGAKADADLEALRTSPQAAAIDEALPRLREAYDRAHDTGVPAYFFAHTRRYFGFAPGATGDDYDDEYGEFGGTKQLVAGIYLHDVARFVPLTRDTDVAQLDLPRRRAVHVHTGIWEGMSHGIMHEDPTLYFVSTSPNPDEDFATKLDIGPEALGIKVVEEDLIGIGFVDRLHVGWQPQGLAVHLQHWGSEAYKVRHHALRVAGDGTRTELPLPVTFEHGFDLLREGAVFFAPKPGGMRLVRRTLEVEGREAPIRLDRDYQEVFVDEDRKFVVLLGRRHFTDTDDWSDVNDTIVSRLDLTTGKVERLAQGKGAGWVVLGSDGALYVETGGTTQRWPTLDATEPGDTMPELHLTMPRDPAFCENCG